MGSLLFGQQLFIEIYFDGLLRNRFCPFIKVPYFLWFTTKLNDEQYILCINTNVIINVTVFATYKLDCDLLVFYVLPLGACVLQRFFGRALRAAASSLELPEFLWVPILLKRY